MIALLLWLLGGLVALAALALYGFFMLASWAVGLVVFIVQVALERRRAEAPRPNVRIPQARWSDRR